MARLRVKSMCTRPPSGMCFPLMSSPMGRRTARSASACPGLIGARTVRQLGGMWANTVNHEDTKESSRLRGDDTPLAVHECRLGARFRIDPLVQSLKRAEHLEGAAG